MDLEKSSGLRKWADLRADIAKAVQRGVLLLSFRDARYAATGHGNYRVTSERRQGLIRFAGSNERLAVL